MLRNVLLIAAISFSTIMLASDQKAEDTISVSGGKINGKVQSFVKQHALPLAQVVVYGETSDIVKVTTTNNKGEFEFNNLPKGKYFITISYLGYKPVIMDGINVESSDDVVRLKDTSLETAFYKIKEVVCKAESIEKTNDAILSSINK